MPFVPWIPPEGWIALELDVALGYGLYRWFKTREEKRVWRVFRQMGGTPEAQTSPAMQEYLQAESKKLKEHLDRIEEQRRAGTDTME